MASTDSTAVIPSSAPSANIIAFNIASQTPLKLTSTNYSAWRFQFQSLLIGYDLLGFVDGPNPCPPPTVSSQGLTLPKTKYSLWVHQNQLLLNALIGAIMPTLILLIASSRTSLEAWNTLAKTYAATSRGRIMQLKAQLSHPMKGSKSITEFLQGIKAIVDALALMNVPIDTEDLTLKVLNGLDENYKNSPLPFKHMTHRSRLMNSMKNY